jgi:hypothetical protein
VLARSGQNLHIQSRDGNAISWFQNQMLPVSK